MFRDVSARVDLPALDARVLAFWKENHIFQKSLEGREEAPLYVFYEGPPTANGRPGSHHIISRIFKDLFPRYKTMRGYRVPRKARLGHARPAGRARGGAQARHRRQEADRGVRHRRVQQALPRERAHLPRGVGALHRAHRLLGGHVGRLLHLRQRLHRDGVVAAAPDLGQGSALPGLQGGAVLPALRHGHQQPRGGAGLQGRHRGLHLRALPARGRGGRQARRAAGRAGVAGGLDDDAVDAHQQRRRGRQAGRRLRPGREPRRALRAGPRPGRARARQEGRGGARVPRRGAARAASTRRRTAS